MADGGFTNEQILPNIVTDADISNTYSFYQRRCPRRLPKIVDYPRDSNWSRKQNNWDCSPPPREEAIPAIQMKQRGHVSGKRDGCKNEVDKEVTKMTLEDFQEDDDEADLRKDIQLQRPTKNTVTFGFENSDHDSRKYVQLSEVDGASRNGCTSTRSSSRSSLCKSPRNATGMPVDNKIEFSCRKKVNRPIKQRSQSLGLYEPTRTPRFVRGSSSPTGRFQRRSCSSTPRKEVDFISKLISQKETSPIQSLMKNKKLKSKTNISTVTLQKRRHTVNHPVEDNVISTTPNTSHIQMECSNIQECCKPEIVKQQADNQVCETPIVKSVDKSSREYFFNNSLEHDTQMELLGNKRYEILPQKNGIQLVKGEPISSQVAYTLRMLLFGSCLSSFTSAWREQTISYVKPDHYALKFYKDGPAEIMAPLQAYILRHLLFFQNKDQQQFDCERLSPSSTVQHHLVLSSLCDMIWKVGEEEHGIIVLPIGECQFIPEYCYRNDEITEKMELFKFTKKDDLELFMKQNIQKFQDVGNHGCISLLYSLMLTRGLSTFLEDCCEMKHGILECDISERSQPLINLCIYGKAVPNVFNNDLEVYDEIQDKTIIHKGVEKRCEVGYLSHSEFVNCRMYKVGSCLKTPRYPVWVVNNSGTLSVLFSMKKELLSDWKLERRFDLYYYQGVARYVPTNEIDIRLTIDTIQTLIENDHDEEENSTLEDTLRTKWADSVIEWNGYTRF